MRRLPWDDGWPRVRSSASVLTHRLLADDPPVARGQVWPRGQAKPCTQQDSMTNAAALSASCRPASAFVRLLDISVMRLERLLADALAQVSALWHEYTMPSKPVYWHGNH